MADSKIYSLQWLRNKIEQLDSNLLREIVKSMAELLMSHEAHMRCNTPYSQKAAERPNHRNVYRQRRWETRVGSIELEFGPIDFLTKNCCYRRIDEGRLISA